MQKPLCTVLIPFNAAGQTRFARIQRSGERLGFETLRVAQYCSSGMILEEVVRSIYDAHLIIADLTGNNANVCYELGIAHALGKRVFLAAERPDTVLLEFPGFKVAELGGAPQAPHPFELELMRFVNTPGCLSPISVFTEGRAISGQREIVRRLAAFVVDSVCSLTFVIPAMLWSETYDWLPEDDLAGLFGIVAMVAYFVLVSMILVTTPGQRLLGLRVIDFDRAAPRYWQRLLRPVAAFLGALSSFGLTFLWAARGPRYQAVHDLLTRSLVVRDWSGDLQESPRRAV